MTSFREWLEEIGLADYGQVLVDNGIDFDVVQNLTEDHLRRLGLNLGDSLRLLEAIARLGQQTAAAHVGAATVTDVLSKPIYASQGELRQLSVMFCDLVGYAALSQRFHNEELKDLTDPFFEVCTKVVEKQYEGKVRQRLGDGVMVYFGLPAHENDPERCVRAALCIVQEVKGL